MSEWVSLGRVECSENKISVATHKLTSCLHICRQHVNLCVLMQCFVLWSGFCSQIPDSYSLSHFHFSPGNPSRSSSSCPLSTRWNFVFDFDYSLFVLIGRWGREDKYWKFIISSENKNSFMISFIWKISNSIKLFHKYHNFLFVIQKKYVEYNWCHSFGFHSPIQAWQGATTINKSAAFE